MAAEYFKTLLDTSIQKPLTLVLPTLLFMLLAPGALLQIPPIRRFGRVGVTVANVIIHTVLYVIVYALLRDLIKRYNPDWIC